MDGTEAVKTLCQQIATEPDEKKTEELFSNLHQVLSVDQEDTRLRWRLIVQKFKRLKVA